MTDDPTNTDLRTRIIGVEAAVQNASAQQALASAGLTSAMGDLTKTVNGLALTLQAQVTGMDGMKETNALQMSGMKETVDAVKALAIGNMTIIEQNKKRVEQLEKDGADIKRTATEAHSDADRCRSDIDAIKLQIALALGIAKGARGAAIAAWAIGGALGTSIVALLYFIASRILSGTVHIS